MAARIFAQGVSIIFHPLLIVTYMLILLYLINPYLFEFHDEKAVVLMGMSVVIISVVFPFISIAMMKMLGLIQGFEMEDSKQRVGPIVASGMFYVWLYVNIKNNPVVPQEYSFFVLGTTIALFIGFFINSFTKISLHTIGMGGMLTGFIFMRYQFGYNSFIVNVSDNISYIVSSDLLLIAIAIITGLVGTCRLIRKAHTEEQIYGGYIVGIFSQLIAYAIVF